MEQKSNITNIKSLIAALIVSFIVVNYVYSRRGEFISFGAAIIGGVMAIVFFLLCFIIVKIIAYFIVREIIYPKIIFRILLPFLSILFISFIVYGYIYFETFGVLKDFIRILKNFAIEIIPFIAISTIITGLIFSTFNEENEIRNMVLFRKNLIFLVVIGVLNILSIYMFYYINKINQPELDIKYSYYKNLNERITSENYEMELLLSDSEYQFGSKPDVSEPYFLVDKNELVIYSSFDDMTNAKRPVRFLVCYKINKDGVIIDKIKDSELATYYGGYLFQDGYLRNSDSTKVVTWVFDGQKDSLKYRDLRIKKDWKIDALLEDKKSIDMVRFFKNNKFHCNDIQSVQYNGTKYYNLFKEKDILKIKIDSVYSHTDRIENCEEKKIVYYNCDGMNFSLLHYDKKEYYIIKSRKK